MDDRSLTAMAAAFLSMLAASMSHAAESDSGRIAIIDASVNTKPYLQTLKDAGVKVIGRYYGRCRQWSGKRIIDGGRAGEEGSEVDAMLDAGFAILSIYQYLSNSKYKFDGRWFNSGTNQIETLKNAACTATAKPHHTAVQEAELDAKAAIEQAALVGQPKGTAIYFGVDFNFDKSDAATKGKMLAYFKTVSGIVKKAEYLLGAYGSGDALAVLKEQSPQLVDFFWLSASRSYAGSTGFHNSDAWHLFQNWTDTEWFSRMVNGRCSAGLALDTDIQNKAFADDYVGFWSRDGEYKVPAERTIAVYDQRRFACNGDALIRSAASSSDLIGVQRCGRQYLRCEPSLRRGLVPQICFGNTVRVGETEGTFARIDYDDDGAFDGWTSVTNLTPSFSVKPAYIFDQAARRAAVCPP
ncbi:glycoside hydrolase domain-containing protein [Methyloceanibacter sp.]|uniref:glycoside hydrolase domain-containing protein n=1 Tax=Methyloceanibacter sp. TaxID=1965321 RepID=UPI003D6D17F7